MKFVVEISALWYGEGCCSGKMNRGESLNQRFFCKKL